MTTHERPFGRYLEDFVPGDVYRHWPGKTITEYDDYLFCMIRRVTSRGGGNLPVQVDVPAMPDDLDGADRAQRQD